MATLIATFLPLADARGQQVILLDFDSGTDGSINYTTSMRDGVQSLMTGFYSPWNYSFVQSAPTSGDFSTITFNSGSAGGLAQHIDLRNLDHNDSAVINVSGFSELVTEADIVSASAVIGAHELGHLLGLRHHDSFGPIGSGVNTAVGGTPWLPDFTGPQDADETFDHIMASPASVGSSVLDTTTPSWISERSAIKLTHADQGAVVNETAGSNNDIANAQSLSLASLVVPNTIEVGDNAGPLDFAVDALSVLGQLESAGDIDMFSFQGFAGDLMNFEVASSSIDHRLSDTIDPQIRIFDSAGNFVDYYGQDAFNDDELEGLDSHIMDLVLPADDIYHIEIRAFSSTDTGEYELFFSRFNGFAAVPEPGCLCLLGSLGMITAMRRRRT